MSFLLNMSTNGFSDKLEDDVEFEIISDISKLKAEEEEKKPEPMEVAKPIEGSFQRFFGNFAKLTFYSFREKRRRSQTQGQRRQ